MPAQFVVHALSCSLGRGKISLKGKKKRPWLEVSRSEEYRNFSKWQLKLLKQLHEGPIDYLEDRLPTNGFYDYERFRFHGEELYRAYELLYPRDERYISTEVLHITSKKGLAMMWFDCGRIKGRRGSIRGKYSPREYENIADYLNLLGIEATPHSNQITTIELCLSREGLSSLLQIIQLEFPKCAYNRLSRRRTTPGTIESQG